MNIPQLSNKKEKRRMAYSISEKVKIISYYDYYVGEKSVLEMARKITKYSEN
jgi:hypothetical protein